MATDAIKMNKLRSTLTLLGIGVGVFSIIGVMTAMGVLQNAIENGLSQLGTNTFQIQKYPALHFGGPREREKYRNRKDLTYEQGVRFVRKMRAKAIGLEDHFGVKQVVYNGEKTNPDVSVMGETQDGFTTNNITIKDGRVFTSEEIESAANVCVLGYSVVEKIFPHTYPVGEYVKVNGVRFKVIGTTDKQGSALGGNQDNFVAIPLTTGLNLYGRERSIDIMVQSFSQDDYEATMDMARAVLRVIRQVPPGADDDFEIFSNDTMIKQFNDITFMVKIGTVGIACIALLAAGVGIMNIMLVSVTERTKEIGIRKALGATKVNILSQFLTESVAFSQIGGVIGIITGSLLGNVVSILMSAPAVMPWNTSVDILQTPFLDFTPLEMNIVALLFCSFIGIVFGVYPAWKAGNLDPIESLRYE
ncbi:MAG: ABC transporter permease [Bacteroidota bacterium]|nr:ABC transporter permease [Bacteroidota bacterium]